MCFQATGRTLATDQLAKVQLELAPPERDGYQAAMHLGRYGIDADYCAAPQPNSRSRPRVLAHVDARKKIEVST